MIGVTPQGTLITGPYIPPQYQNPQLTTNPIGGPSSGTGTITTQPSGSGGQIPPGTGTLSTAPYPGGGGGGGQIIAGSGGTGTLTTTPGAPSSPTGPGGTLTTTTLPQPLYRPIYSPTGTLIGYEPLAPSGTLTTTPGGAGGGGQLPGGQLVTLPPSSGQTAGIPGQCFTALICPLPGGGAAPTPPATQPPQAPLPAPQTPQQQPAQGQLHTGPPGALPKWCDATVCQQLDTASAAITELTTRTPLSYLLGVRKEDGQYDTTNPFFTFIDGLPFGIGNAVFGFIQAIDRTLKDEREAGNIPAVALTAPALILQLLRFVTRWTGIEIKSYEIAVQRWMDYASPDNPPSTADMNGMLLANTVSDDEWRCIVRGNNDCDTWQERIVQAGRARPNPAEVAQLYLRKKIDEPEYRRRMRENGVLSSEDRTLIHDLQFQQPTLQDIVTMMVRDVFDPAVVEKYQYDADFDQKFTGAALNLAEAVGFDKETAKLFWRAHWDLPSNQAAYEMLHRLRPGAVDPSIETTAADVEKLLDINDIPLYWRKRLMAISYNPLTRVDVRRMYNIGALSREEVVNAYQDAGYEKTNAERLAKFAERDRRKSLLALPEGKSYLKGGLSTDQFKDRLFAKGISRDDIDWAVSELEFLRSVALREKCVESTHKRYLAGGLTFAEVVSELIQVGLKPDQATSLSAQWDCELSSRSKQVTAAMLLKWYQDSLITDTDLAQRLARLNYTAEALDGIVRDAQLRKSIALTKAANTEAKKQAAELKARQDAIKKAQAEREKKAVAATKEAEKLYKANSSFEEIRDRTAFAYWTLTQEEPGKAIEQVTQWAEQIAERQGIAKEAAIKIVNAAVAATAKAKQSDVTPLIRAAMDDTH